MPNPRLLFPPDRRSPTNKRVPSRCFLPPVPRAARVTLQRPNKNYDVSVVFLSSASRILPLAFAICYFVVLGASAVHCRRNKLPRAGLVWLSSPGVPEDRPRI
ncbi:hypothetical protein Zmor_025862 [Zophobas morio]|uniref:Uncharacterized protein n=1 Tax=Zophobas morio TaxID=2755281 RepID=A0AA38M4Z6_9CUCU|nr:hypothetical protein Zmor_025862 [Zophobas morio]